MNPEFEAVLRRHLPYLGADTPLDPQASLKGLGLDSMKAVDLVFDLEDDLHVAVPDEAMTASTFATPGSLWAVLTDVREQAAVG